MRLLPPFLFAPLLFAAELPPPVQEPWQGVPEGFRNLPIGKFKEPRNLKEWQAYRREVKSIILRSLGEIPPRPASLPIRTVSTEDKGAYTVEKFVFHNGVDSEVPGYIAIPKNRQGRLPAILTMHGHSSSKDDMFGYRTSSQYVSDLLATNGYVVLGIDNYFNGERKGKGPAGEMEVMAKGSDQEMSLFKLNLWLGRTLWGMMLRDEQIALDYLSSRPEVDPSRIGAQGMSMGSTRSWWLGAIDDRVRAVVGVACFTRYEDLIATRNLRAHGIYYFVPGILRHFDSEAIMALLAPRPFLALTGDRDAGSPPTGMKKLEETLSRLYALHGAAEKFRSVIYPDTGHVYTDDMKQKMLAWFDAHLKSGGR
jgi:dienelactone hydrolase